MRTLRGSERSRRNMCNVHAVGCMAQYLVQAAEAAVLQRVQHRVPQLAPATCIVSLAILEVLLTALACIAVLVLRPPQGQPTHPYVLHGLVE